MALPTVPPFDKTSLPTGPWTPALTALLGLLTPFLKNTVETLRSGVPVVRPLDLDLVEGGTYPTREYASPLPEGVVPTDLVVSNVTDPASPGKSPGLTGGVTVPWTLGPTGGIVVLACTGLPTGARRTVRVLVSGG